MEVGALLTGIFSAFGLSASAGLNAYIPLLAVSLLGRFTNLLNLQEPWNTLESWWIIALLVVLIVVEFFADKVPAINHINDGIQTFVRPAAGAVAFAASAQVVTEINPILSLAAGLLVAGGVHVAKAGALRPTVTATTGGTANIFVSILEDILATVLSILAIIIPVVLGGILVLAISWLIWHMWKRENERMARQQQGTA